MKETDEEERALRRYLLGELSGAEQDLVEERFLTDPEFKETVLMTEDELVQDYLAAELSEAEHKLFISHFLSTPEQRQKLKITGSLKKYLADETPLPAPKRVTKVPLPGAGESGLKHWPFWRNPWVFVPASLAVILAMAIGSVWLVGNLQRRNRLVEIRQEFEWLNGQPADAALPSVFLTPLIVRGGGASNTLSLPRDGADVQLWLLLITDEYHSYQVILQKNGDTEQFAITGRRAEITPRGKAIRFRIPSRLLSPGVYILKLNGIADNGPIEEIGEYSFAMAA